MVIRIYGYLTKKETIDAATTLRKSSNISSVDTRDAPRNRESAPPNVFKKSQTSGYCFFSFTSSTSRDSKKIFTYIKWKTLDKADWISYYATRIQVFVTSYLQQVCIAVIFQCIHIFQVRVRGVTIRSIDNIFVV